MTNPVDIASFGLLILKGTVDFLKAHQGQLSMSQRKKERKSMGLQRGGSLVFFHFFNFPTRYFSETCHALRKSLLRGACVAGSSMFSGAHVCNYKYVCVYVYVRHCSCGYIHAISVHVSCYAMIGGFNIDILFGSSEKGHQAGDNT